jgi:hypothetical protein
MKGGTTMPKRRKIGKKTLTRVAIEVEPRDEIDWDRFAWALFQYCRIKLESEADEEQSEL